MLRDEVKAKTSRVWPVVVLLSAKKACYRHHVEVCLGSLLIYLFPVVMDMVLASVSFLATVWAAEKGSSASSVANLLTLWAGTYMVVSLAVGRIVTRRNAAWLIIGTCLATSGLSLLFAICASLKVMYLLMALMGVATAMFFTPFQVFMKVVGEGRRRSIIRSVGLYTLSWSSGYALGPFAAAFLWERVGWMGCHGINAMATLAVAVATGLLKHHATSHPVSATGQTEAMPAPASEDATEYSNMPDLAWMGWLFSGIGCMAITLIRGLFPCTGVDCRLARIDQGLILCTLSATQALLGFALGWARQWMYRPLPVLAFGVCGVLGLVLIAVARTTSVFYLATFMFGLYSGSFFFYLVFHSLVHSEKSACYVSVNEAIVGLTSMAGPFLGGIVADRYAPGTSYLMVAGIVVMAVVVQTYLHTKLAISRY